MSRLSHFSTSWKRPAPWLATLMLGAVVATGALVVSRHLDYANILLTVLVFAVTVATLWVVIPKPAHLMVVRPDELEIADLIFSLQSAMGTVREVPAGILLQLHAAVINDGGRKVLLSSLRLVGLVRKDGDLHLLPGFQEALAGQLYSQVTRRRSSRQMQVEVESETVSLPIVLPPDDVVILRFRARRGIDWSPKWTLEELRRFGASIESPIVAARLQLRYRRGRELTEAMVDIPCEVSGQEEYATLLRGVTREFRETPSIQPLAIEIE